MVENKIWGAFQNCIQTTPSIRLLAFLHPQGMFDYHRFFLDNGLEVIVHEDSSSKIAVFNLLYKVGSRFEKPGKTG